MTTRTIERPRADKITELVKGWRNRWRAISDFPRASRREWIRAGQEYWGLGIFPSKDIAETEAHLSLQDELRVLGNNLVEYLGAFPIEVS